jgi:3-dehydroquinate dehydratase-2
MLSVINGPNLSQQGRRDPSVYGTATLETVAEDVRSEVAAHPDQSSLDVELVTFEVEGELVARLHRARDDGTAAVLINPGALTHYSYALADALELLTAPKVELHLSQTYAREAFRRHSVISPVVDVTITGAGAFGYRLAAQAALRLRQTRDGDA